MRVLMFGDLAPTGFGTVTNDLGKELIKLGIDLRFVSQNDTGEDLPEPFRSRTLNLTSLLPQFTQGAFINSVVINSIGDKVTDIIADLVKGTTTGHLLSGDEWGGWEPEAIILLGDYRAALEIVQRSPQAFADKPTFHYVPVEGVDLPPRWKGLWSVITPVAMCQFGADELEKVMGERPPVVYHGVDSEVFHPATPNTPVVLAPPGRSPVKLTSKDECKAMWAAFFGGHMPRKWILRTDRHMPRKRQNSLIRAMVPVLARQPDTVLVLHCNPQDLGGILEDTLSKVPAELVTRAAIGNEQLPEGYGLFGRPYPQIFITNLSLERAALVSLYNAADLYVSVSAEGFGLTIAEALACGVPAVGIDYSAVPEVIGPAGVTVKAAYLVENEYDHFWAAIDEEELTRKVEFLITHQTRREDLGRKGPTHIATNFRWDAAAAAFSELLHSSVVDRQAA